MDKKKIFSSTGLIVAVVLLLVINLLAGLLFKSVRLDMTQNSLYTLSQGTENILKKIDEPITLRFYFSEKQLSGIPPVLNYGRRVQELLEQYANIAGNKLRLVVADPEPFSDAEDQAVGYGLQGVPIDAAGTQAYLGLVGTNSVDAQEVIPFLGPDKEDSLEYDITKLVYNLTNPSKKTVGVISGLPIEGGAPNPFMQGQDSQEWFFLSQLKQLFDVRMFDQKVTKLDDDIDVIMIIHPKDLSEQAQFAIDQFVLKGGRALVFVDPNSEADMPPGSQQNPMAAMQAKRSSDMKKLFSAWGIELVDGQIAGDRNSATRIAARAGLRSQAISYVAWLSLKKQNMNKQDFVTAGLDNVTMATSGFLKKKEGANIDFSPLMQTSDQAMSIPQTRFAFQSNILALAGNLLEQYQPGGEKLTLAARISGKFKSAFPNGIKDGDKTITGLTESKQASNIIVVADTDMLENRMWVQLQNFFGNRIGYPKADNGAFVVNAVDNLTGNNDLISLRSRGRSARPFDKVLSLRDEAEERFRDKERQLQGKLKETERKLADLQRQKTDGSAVILSDAQRQEIENFRAEQLATRKELRSVQHRLTQDIEDLGGWLKFINIAGVPLIFIVIALVTNYYRKKRLRESLMSV